MAKKHSNFGTQNDFRSKLDSRAKSESTSFPAEKCDIEKDMICRHKTRKELFSNVEKHKGQAQAQTAAKSSSYKDYEDCEAGLHNRACRDNIRTKFWNRIPVDPYESQVPPVQVPATDFRESDIEKVNVYRHKFRKEFLAHIERREDQTSRKSPTRIVYTECQTGLNDRACRDDTCPKFLNTVPGDPYGAQVSSTQTSNERYKEKTLRGKEKMRDCKVKCPPQQEHQSGGDAHRLFNDRPCTACIDDDCCTRRACNLSLRQLGQHKKWKSRAKSSPHPKHKRGSSHCPFGQILDSDTTISELDIPSDDGNATASSTANSRQYVREIRKLMTSRCKLHDLITTSLKSMGYDDDEVTPKSKCKDQRASPPRRIKSSPHEMSPRHHKVERKPQKLNDEVSLFESPFPGGMSRRPDAPPEVTPPLNSGEDLETHHERLRNGNVIKTSEGDNFKIGVHDAVHAKVIAPVIRKMQQMHLRAMRSELSVMEDIEALPSQLSQMYKRFQDL